MAQGRKLVLAPVDYERVQGMAAAGWRLKDIARALAISTEALRTARQRDPQLDAAIEAGRGEEHQALVSRLFEIATKSKGKEAVTACIFLLKTRHGYREGEAVDQGGARVGVVINLPGALEPDAYRRLVEVHPRAIEADSGAGDE